MWRRALRAAVSAGAFGGAVFGASCVVHASRGRDTCCKLFHDFATEEREGTLYMTVEDFVRSLLRRSGIGSLHAAALADVEALFKCIDSDADGLLSFQEFSLFMTLLTNKEEDMRMLCKMHDTDGSNSVELEEYKTILSCLSNDPTVEYSFDGALTDFFFGPQNPDGSRRPLSLERFLGFVRSLRRRVVEAEFRAFVPEGCAAISAESFSRLLLGSGQLPEGIAHNLPKLQALDKETGGQSVQIGTWLAFADMALNLDELAEAFAIYKRAGLDVGKHDLVRAISAAAPSLVLTRSDVALLTILFGNSDGTINDAELVKALRARQYWGMRTTDRQGPQRNFVQAVFKCVTDAQIEE